MTYPAGPEALGDGALFEGTVADEHGCLIFVFPNGERALPVFASNDAQAPAFRDGDAAALGGGATGHSLSDLTSEVSIPPACADLQYTTIFVAQREPA